VILAHNMPWSLAGDCTFLICLVLLLQINHLNGVSLPEQQRLQELPNLLVASMLAEYVSRVVFSFQAFQAS